MVYNNSFDFFLKVLGKDFPIKILQTSKLIECQYNCIEYSQKTKFIDTNLKLAMKHFLIQAQVDYLDSICFKKNLTSHDLGFFTNMFVLRGLTSAPSIDLLNIETNRYEKIKTTFFSDKMISGVIGSQYLSPITSFVFAEDWTNLTKIHKYEKILDYDKKFNLQLLSDVNTLAESIWKARAFSGEYNNFDDFLFYLKNLFEQQYWIHNYGDFKIYKNLNDYILYPEIYQILYNLKFEYNDLTNESKIYFDSLFFDKSLMLETDLSNYKSIEDFKDQLINWREKGEIIEIKKSLTLLNSINQEYIIDDYIEKDLSESFDLLFKNADENGVICYLLLIEDKNLNFQKLKLFLNEEKISFYYYIPFYETIEKRYNLLLIGFKKNDSVYFEKVFENYIYFNSCQQIKNYFLRNITWTTTNLYNHYLYWSDTSQIIVSSFLDFVSGGLITLLPKTWNC